MNNRVRTVFNRRKQASDTTCAAVEIVVCLGRERFYFSIGIFLNATQWLDGKVINHPKAAIFNEQIQKKVTEFERIIIAMEVNGDDMTTQQFKTYLSSDSCNRRNFMAWMRERIQSRKMREGTRKGHLTTYKALQRFGKFKTFDDITLTHIYEFDMFIREEETYTSTSLLNVARLPSTIITNDLRVTSAKPSVWDSSKIIHTTASKTNVARRANVHISPKNK